MGYVCYACSLPTKAMVLLAKVDGKCGQNCSYHTIIREKVVGMDDFLGLYLFLINLGFFHTYLKFEGIKKIGYYLNLIIGTISF
jgi:hypothetical protein